MDISDILLLYRAQDEMAISTFLLPISTSSLFGCRFIFERTAAANNANGQVDHLLDLAVPFFTKSAILFFLLGLPLERFLLLIRTILRSQRKAGRDLLQNECSNEVGETLAVAFFRIKECGDMLI